MDFLDDLVTPSQTKSSVDTSLLSKGDFSDLHLDERLLQTIDSLGWKKPSLIQSAAIPLVLQGKDVLAKSRTGSGKTAAYSLPAIQIILNNKVKVGNARSTHTSVLILVPTRDLCEQVHSHFEDMITNLRKDITVASIGHEITLDEQKAILKEYPDVIISTPGRIAEHIQKKNTNLNNLSLLIIDEADLILSHGYENEMKEIATSLPRICQSLLFSATLDESTEMLKKLVLRTPVILQMKDTVKGQLLEYHLGPIKDIDKFLILYTMLRLRVISGRAIVFVRDIQRSIKLRMFLSKFGLKAASINTDLPYNSRIRIIESFNRGQVDYLIATDAGFEETDERQLSSKEYKASLEDKIEEIRNAKDADDDEVDTSIVKEEEGEAMKVDDDEEEEEEEEEKEEDDEEEEEEEKEEDEEDEEEEEEDDDDDDVVEPTTAEEAARKKKMEEHREKMLKYQQQKKATAKKDVGVVRGIDFKNVDTVVNFDIPRTITDYIHRIGRTARGDANGTAITFVSTYDRKKMVNLRSERETINPYKFNLALVEGFRYRVENVYRILNQKLIKLTRIDDIKQEIIQSEKLQEHFSKHENELNLLKKKANIRTMDDRAFRNLNSLPEYLLPDNVQAVVEGREKQAKKRHHAADQLQGKKKKIRRAERIRQKGLEFNQFLEDTDMNKRFFAPEKQKKKRIEDSGTGQHFT
ncbi:hypothetical protein PROFUN_04588 [Planoprotostelium fungivorum]|uniref:RNA helicase n=1 Tax=Planoprotostelium fungivorum TaxID=1890364 RepID=A0A2P6NUD0_9EUKA|nr:hypothetical protein PROFUN_04588 [Planoprotostelium fungivorum]